ncbi:ABC transporter permease [Candidatus Beckwithbacteria bacterium]|nr:ABC transporter permease [Candidatus Beckwithbacteria bacterium]
MVDKITIIKPQQGFISINFKELWRYRELLLALMIRDIKVRYKQTYLGIAWAIMQPFTQMVVFSFFFGKLAKIPSDGVPYPIFSYSGLILWTFFSNSISAVSNSMINSSTIIKKVYFPRLISPIASSLVYIVDYIIAFTILIGLIFFYNFPLRLEFLLIPMVVFGTWLLSIGVGCFLASINIRYRDVRYALPFFIQLLLYITPVIYPASVAGQFEWIVNINPMTGFMELHRSLILGLPIKINQIIISLIITIVFLVIGLLTFKKMEKNIVDIV